MKLIVEVTFTPDVEHEGVNNNGVAMLSNLLEDSPYVTEVKYKVIKDDSESK